MGQNIGQNTNRAINLNRYFAHNQITDQIIFHITRRIISQNINHITLEPPPTPCQHQDKSIPQMQKE